MSREYRGKRVVVWPSYIDASKSRGQGRKIPRKDAVPRPRVEEIVEAAERLGLNPEVEEARYPRAWWEDRQRVVVDKLGSKLETLKAIAREIRRIREERRMVRR
ncbi:Ribonucleoprotein complex SRP, Srp19 component [Pyrolobus fumarii 1A]|uniref:Signal recognition particle 19 kDa protein n=1 Tax=Pyrolobus fumarii (strain DSM 11204 / 1A) TaxID=694429 RepID=G0EDN2_PYRF1|nr:signal recognition particle protein Srp19 [Pyrolobus fumarii]AEM39836.1 Ribonucleoprotein complex SRP, Srp19 component [Pyrolobus fumarii 1A]